MSNLGRKLLDKPYALWAVLFVLAPLCMVSTMRLRTPAAPFLSTR